MNSNNPQPIPEIKPIIFLGEVGCNVSTRNYVKIFTLPKSAIDNKGEG